MSYYNPASGIGFRPEVLGHPLHPGAQVGPPQGTHPLSARSGYGAAYDTSKDLTFMRILSAEEFLIRMAETDGAICHWSQCEDRELHYAQVKELVGLRGHLQDELLRILAMLSEGDPNLQSLNDFEDSYPNVTQHLRELHRKSQQIQIQSIDIGMDTSETQPTGSMLPDINQGHNGVRGQGQSVGTQASSRSQSAGTQSQGHSIAIGENDGEEVIETQLKPRFVAEENHLNENFTKRIVQGGRQLTKTDMDGLLNEHAIHMQALRKKQDLEREKYKELLDAKKRERLLTRRAANQSESSNLQSRKTAPSQQRNKGEYFFIDFSNFDNKKVAKKPVPNRTTPGSANWFYVDMDGKTTTDVQKVKNVSTSSAGVTSRNASQQTHKPVAVVTAVQHTNRNGSGTNPSGSEQGLGDNLGSLESLSGSEDENLEENYEDDFEDEDSDNTEDKEELKTTLKDDLWSTLREREGTSKEDFQELLGAYRDQEEGRKNIRDSENLKHKSSFLAKLAERKKKGNSSEMSSVSSQGSAEEDPFVNELEEIKKVDNDLVKKLLAQRRNMTDAEFQELLRRHLADVDKLRRQRASDRENLDAKLRDKLNLRKGRPGSAQSENAAEEDRQLNRELTDLDMKLQDELRRRGKNIDECDLEELLEHYRRQQGALLRKRTSDKAKTDDKLKKKLEEKRRMKKEYQEAQDSESPKPQADTSFFQEVQTLQAGGQLTEEMFSRLLGAHLDQGELGKREKRQKQIARERQNNQEAAQTAATTLVQESQQQTKQIQGIRQREKDAIDQKLQRKLQAKKNKKMQGTDS